MHCLTPILQSCGQFSLFLYFHTQQGLLSYFFFKFMWGWFLTDENKELVGCIKNQNLIQKLKQKKLKIPPYLGLIPSRSFSTSLSIFISLLVVFIISYILQMRKNILFVLLLLGSVNCLRLSHLEESSVDPPAPTAKTTVEGAETSATKTTTEATAQAPADKNQVMQAYSRLLQFIGNDRSIANTVLNDDQTSEKQEKKFKKFMVGDEYFQKLMLAKLLEKPGNEWVGELDFSDQIKYLQITASLTPIQAQDPEKRAKVVAALLEDPEIGGGLRKKYGQNINVEDIMQTSDVSIDQATQHQLYLQATHHSH